ncbi:MAG TPA: TlpA disulfide reductase family protein [Vicinamibacteria bacterium]
MKARTFARWTRFSAALFLGGALAASPADPKSLAGRWDAVVVANGVEVPFPFEIAVDGSSVTGSFFNGERRVTSTAGELVGDALTLHFAQYATTLHATLGDGALKGEYQRPKDSYPFRASRARERSHAASAEVPAIEGTWIASAKSNKGEAAWRFIARQTGDAVEATILRVDGDTGTLNGSFQDGRFVLSHFSGARALLLEVTPQQDGTLSLKMNGKTDLRAAREGTTAAASIGAPTDTARHTAVKDPSEPFRFSFPDLAGRTVSDTDENFRNKVVLVSISGSWCPNCHDEAPFLASLYRKYRARGLEIVSLSFEEGEQLKNPERLRAFIANYGIDYVVLLAGEPKELAEKIPQAVNLNAFPTTFFLGRDGRVRAVHAGFPSPGSGAFYEEAEREMIEQLEKLLAEGESS